MTTEELRELADATFDSAYNDTELDTHVTANDIKKFSAAIYSALLKVEQGQWIGVEERLPEVDAVVLAYSQTACDPVVALYDGHGNDGESWTDWEGTIVDPVTHWRPLPSPPATHIENASKERTEGED